MSRSETCLPVTKVQKMMVYAKAIDTCHRNASLRGRLGLPICLPANCSRDFVCMYQAISFPNRILECQTGICPCRIKHVLSMQLNQNWLRNPTNDSPLKQLAVCTCAKTEQTVLLDAALTRYFTNGVLGPAQGWKCECSPRSAACCLTAGRREWVQSAYSLGVVTDAASGLGCLASGHAPLCTAEWRFTRTSLDPDRDWTDRGKGLI